MDKSREAENSSISDEELLREIAKGQVRAFSLFYDRYAPQLFGLALKILQNRTLAEDVIQDVFIKVWKTAKTFDEKRGSPGGWITILCRNRCIDVLRSRESRQKRSGVLVDEYALQRALANDENDPFKKANTAELKQVIKRGMKTLPEEQRILIEMAYFGGYSQSEISAELEVPLGTVKTRMRLAMQKLRTYIAPKIKP